MIPVKKALPDYLDLGRSVLLEEAHALRTLAASLGSEFNAAVDMLCGCQGRIIVTGMGKSGHIARKIAATLNSTGTPALFIHPAEAGHGDLGGIVQKDIILALSNSGESQELAEILSYADRLGLPVLALTSVPESSLARHSFLVLPLLAIGEAGPLGCAPTTSTTMMLALGDALAMAVLKAKGVSRFEFCVYHPGGSLGRRLLLVSQIMHSGDSLPLVAPDLSMMDALCEMTTKGFGCLAVVDKDRHLLGMVADGDLRRNMDSDFLNKSLTQIMTVKPRVINALDTASKALATMNANLITNLLVVDEQDRVIGIVHMHDCLRAGLV